MRRLRRLILSLGAAALAVSPLSTRADVAFIAILSVPLEEQVAFDALAQQMVAAAAKNEGMLIYEFARVGDRVYGYERYTDAAAHGRHEEIIAPFLDELNGLASFDAIVTLSDLTDAHRDAFAAIGAEIGEPIASIAQGEVGR